MGNHVQGKNIGGYLKVGSEYYPLFCGKTLNFGIQQEELETTNIASGSYKDFEAGMSSAMMEVGGVTILDNSDGRIAASYLMQQGVRRVKQDWKITKTDNDGGILIYTFKGIILSTGFDKSIPGYSQSFVSVRVCGAIESDIIPPPLTDFDVFSDYWQTVNGQNYIDGDSAGESNASPVAYTPFELDDDDMILEVDMEGTQYDVVSGTPTPGTRECQFASSPTVRIIFPADVIFDGTQRVHVELKRLV